MLKYDSLNSVTTTVGQVPRLARPYRPRGRLMRDGKCAAAVRAIAGARGYLSGQFPTLSVAANSCGSNPSYVAAATVVLKADDSHLLADVLAGVVPLLEAAASVSNAVAMIEAFDKSTRAERRIFGKAVGPAAVFDDAVVAAL
jgi:hypothetical protein